MKKHLSVFFGSFNIHSKTNQFLKTQRNWKK